jgi:hypothetical protein
MPEAVRLVIWDLDDTFWKRTLTKGDITAYVQAHHDCVIELARRGIVSFLNRSFHLRPEQVIERII